jgi:hypothetical protein
MLSLTGTLSLFFGCSLDMTGGRLTMLTNYPAFSKACSTWGTTSPLALCSAALLFRRSCGLHCLWAFCRGAVLICSALSCGTLLRGSPMYWSSFHSVNSAPTEQCSPNRPPRPPLTRLVACTRLTIHQYHWPAGAHGRAEQRPAGEAGPGSVDRSRQRVLRRRGA